MRKYYTPKIEDFYVGFEYEAAATFTDGTVKTQEQFDNAIWSKEVFGIGDAPYVERALRSRNADANRCGIQVRYLDQLDILELDWKLIIGENPIACDDFYGSNPVEGLQYEINDWRLVHFNETKNTTIYYMNNEWFKKGVIQYFFVGKIKNKNELKILMKQLNIK